MGLPYFKCFPSDFISDPDVLRMSDEQVGVYFRLLCLAWLDGGSLPDDLGEIARTLHTTRRRLERLWPGLAPCWISDGKGRLVNPRQHKDRAAAEAQHQELSEAGKKGAAKRWGG